MKLVIGENNELLVETSIGTMPVREAFLLALRKDGRTITRLEQDCLFSDGRLRSARGKRVSKPSVQTYLLAFLEMGYGIEIKESLQETRRNL